jgi:hypothetical protein
LPANGACRTAARPCLGAVFAWSLFLPSPAAGAEVCYLYTPYEYQRTGGYHRLGPFGSSAECKLTKDLNFRRSHDARCDCSEATEPAKKKEQCYLYTPLWYQRQGGPHRHGPFSSLDACKTTRDTKFRGSHDARCDCT